MRLLVSVRSAAEVDPALAGGADVIDAKEPSRGSLGPVSADTLTRILVRLPSNRAFSAALGDFASDAAVVAGITALDLPPRQAPTFLKLGFAGVTSPMLVGRLLTSAVQVAAELPTAPLIVAVAYADAQQAGTMSAQLICQLAYEARAAGVLIDTYRKAGSGLLEWISPTTLAAWVCDARQAGLLCAVAGGLRLDDLEAVQAAAPDIVGFRGAACDGGRSGEISAERVAGLRRHLDQVLGRTVRHPPEGAWQNA